MTIIRNFANTATFLSANGQYLSSNLSGQVASSQVSGLAAVATSGSASDISTGTLPSAVYTVGATGINAMNVYTSPATWTKPATIKGVKVTVQAAGGSGGTAGGNNAYGTTGGGSGAGGFKIIPAASIPGPVAVTVGVGGVGVTNPAPASTNGNPGGTSSFGSLISATGGSGGPAGPGFAQPSSTGGTFTLSSTAFGLPGTGANYEAEGSPAGASILFGAWGPVYGNGSPGNYSSFTSVTSTAGKPGFVIVEEFY